MKNKPYKKTGQIFKALREEDTYNEERGEHYSIRELARRMDDEQYYSRISQIETGEKQPSINDLKRYHKFFNVPYEYLLGETANKDYQNITLGNKLGLYDDAINYLKKLNYKDKDGARNPFNSTKLKTINELFKIINKKNKEDYDDYDFWGKLARYMSIRKDTELYSFDKDDIVDMKSKLSFLLSSGLPIEFEKSEVLIIIREALFDCIKRLQENFDAEV